MERLSRQARHRGMAGGPPPGATRHPLGEHMGHPRGDHMGLPPHPQGAVMEPMEHPPPATVLAPPPLRAMKLLPGLCLSRRSMPTRCATLGIQFEVCSRLGSRVLAAALRDMFIALCAIM